MRYHTIGIAACALLSTLLGPASAGARETRSLDGVWSFATDPGDYGESERWFAPDRALPAGRRPGYAPHADGKILVPGCWDAQGYGTETEKLRHNFIGTGWYKRTVTIPREWTGKRLFLCIGGVHRSARVWVNGAYLGDHSGYISSFEFEITRHVQPGEKAVIAIAVDSRPHWETDPLLGSSDIVDYMELQWGAIWGHVTLEARDAAWLEDPFVQPALPDRCTVSAHAAGSLAPGDSVRLEIRDGQGRTVTTATTPAATDLKLDAVIPHPQLWSVQHPALYTASLALCRDGRVLDQIHTRFGMRQIEIRGDAIYLNGKRVFLNGYGDDAIYPESIVTPVDKQFYLKRLRTIKSYGFTFVRHHSHIMPPEYYDACDEAGMLVSGEFPIVYSFAYNRAANYPAAMEAYQREWAAAIKRHRNHPSLFDWCLGNEFWDGVPLRHPFRRIATELDPTRPFADSDGLMLHTGWVESGRDRDTLDLFFYLFDAWNLPLDVPDKYKFDKAAKPVISHETGNYITFPRLDQIDRFKDDFKPFWLTQAKDRLQRQGLLSEAGLWAKNSERLYLLCHKLNLEAMRKNPHISGHQWWLFQDFWTTSNGLVDAYFRPKSIRPEQVLPFNNDVVLLQDGLQLAYRGGDLLPLKLLVSNFSEDALRDGSLSWQVKLGNQTLAQHTFPAPRVEQGTVTGVGELSAKLPEVDAPRMVTVQVSLTSKGRRFTNEWSTWLYPRAIAAPRLPVPLYTDPLLVREFARYGAKPIPHGEQLPAPAIYVTNLPTTAQIDAAARGACLVCLNPQPLFPAAVTRFKTAWWKGGENDANAGTVAYPNPVTEAVTPEGWCDASWHPLLEGSQGILLDDLPAQPRVLLRGIEDMNVCRNKALLLEAGVGQGCLLVSGLNHTRAQDTPQNEWLLSRLFAYAGTLPHPAATLPVEYLRSRCPDISLPAGPYLSGFTRLKTNEGEIARWHTYRENDVDCYSCRQTKPGNLIAWETAPAPTVLPAGSTATFLFAGGLGWKEEPDAGGFSFLVNGKKELDFNLTFQPATWHSADGAVKLIFIPMRLLPQDAVGIFYVQLSAARLTPGQPCTLGVVSKGSGSKRWFSLHPYTDLADL